MSHEMLDQRFKLEIFTPEKANVYLACPETGDIAWPLIRQLDQAGLQVIGDIMDLVPDDDRCRRIVGECSGFVAILPYCDSEPSTTAPRLLRELRFGAARGVPLTIFQEKGVRLAVSQLTDALKLQFGDSDPIITARSHVYGPITYDNNHSSLDQMLPSITDSFLAAIFKERDRIQPYAFLIGRLERDFTQAREAIRVAVESEAGIPCLWSDDGRHRTNIESIRERTRLLIKYATFVIADLTLGSENPQHENPSRAHEIGMAIAYGRPLMLSSQEPRRYPYFSIGDLQMTFWSTEEDLASKVTEWIYAYRDSLGRTVFNHRFAHTNSDYEPNLKRPCFKFDPKQRYVGPGIKRASAIETSGMMLSFGAIAFALAHLVNLYFPLDNAVYWAAYVAVGLVILFAPHLSGKTSDVLGGTRFLHRFLLLTALTLLTLAFTGSKWLWIGPS